jgi:3-methyladenine DNA glycosylase AlkC
MQTPKRKGAKSINDIPADIFAQLNAGEIESANLVEWLAINQTLLLQNTLHAFGRNHYLAPVLEAIAALKKPTVNTRNEAIGATLLAQSQAQKDDDFLNKISTHPADAVRCWATYTVSKNQDLTLAQKIEKMAVFAADTHFGVREIAWLSLRPYLSEKLTESLSLLTEWTTSADENIRRFASEATRPRGVWCAHIDILKQNPALGLPILTPLKSDPAKYVQDSVANWLNDASKTQPDFVKNICAQWTAESPTKETAYIVKRALRSMA